MGFFRKHYFRRFYSMMRFYRQTTIVFHTSSNSKIVKYTKGKSNPFPTGRGGGWIPVGPLKAIFVLNIVVPQIEHTVFGIHNLLFASYGTQK